MEFAKWTGMGRAAFYRLGDARIAQARQALIEGKPFK
jgi:hypothetical protein